MMPTAQAQKMVDDVIALGNPTWSTDFKCACEIQEKRTAAHHAYCEAIGLGQTSDADDTPEQEQTAYHSWTVFESHAPAIAARAFNEDMQDLSDTEIDRVFNPCANPVLCKVVIRKWKATGRLLCDLYALYIEGYTRSPHPPIFGAQGSDAIFTVGGK